MVNNRNIFYLKTGLSRKEGCVRQEEFRLGLFSEAAPDRQKEGMEHGRMFGSRDLCGAIFVIVRMIWKM